MGKLCRLRGDWDLNGIFWEVMYIQSGDILDTTYIWQDMVMMMVN